jgi:L-iditol 2-dehydrogenase
LGRTNICENFQIIGLHFDGGLAEYAKLNARYAHKVPDKLDDYNAALVEPTTVAVHAVYANADFGPRSVVVVSGCGPIGLLVAQAARTRGTDRVIITGLDSDEETRLSAARRLGLRAVNVQRENLGEVVKELSDGHGADVAFESSGSTRAFVEDIELLRKGGRLVIIGYPSQNVEIFATPLIRREITLQGNISGLWEHFEMAIELMAQGRIETNFLITKFGLEEAVPALEAASGRQILKAVLVP